MLYLRALSPSPHLPSQQLYQRHVMISTLKMRKLRCKELNYHIQGHQLVNGRLKIQTQVCQATESTVLATKHQCLSSAWNHSWIHWKKRLSFEQKDLKRKIGFIYRRVKSVASNKGSFGRQGIFGTAWRHFWLSQLGACYLHLVGRSQDATKHPMGRTIHPTNNYLV